MRSAKNILGLWLAVILQFGVMFTSSAQTKLYRFSCVANDRVLVAQEGNLSTVSSSSLANQVAIEHLFIIKWIGSDCYIASASDNSLFLKREGANVVLGSLSADQSPSVSFKWRIDYAGSNHGVLSASDDASQCLFMANDGSLSMVNGHKHVISLADKNHIRFVISSSVSTF